MKKILVPTDFSKCADSAMELAIDLAVKLKAEIEFVHLLSTPVDWVRLPLEKEKLYPETKAQINKAKVELKARVQKAEDLGVEAKFSIVFNQGSVDILPEIHKAGLELIVMGSNGDSGVHESLIGSNAQHVIRKSKVPALIVKKPTKSSIDSLVFVSDFQNVSKNSFTTITSFADAVGCSIDLLFVNTPSEFKNSTITDANMDNALTHCSRAVKCSKTVVNASSVEAGVREFIAQNDVDLVAICTHGKSGMAQLFSPSVAERMVNHLDIPILVIKL